MAETFPTEFAQGWDEAMTLTHQLLVHPALKEGIEHIIREVSDDAADHIIRYLLAVLT